MARGGGTYGNLPPSMGRANPAIRTGGGKTSPSNPIGPGTPKSISAPNQTMAKVSSPIGPGMPRNKSQPNLAPLGNNAVKAVGSVRPHVVEGVGNPAGGAKQPMLPGIPGREGTIKAGRNNAGYGKKSGGKTKVGGRMGKGSGGLKAAGVPPGYGP